MSNALFIAGLPFNMNERDIQRVLEGFGHVSSITLVKDKTTGKSRGFCFAEMKEESAARAALQQLNGALVGGRKVYVDPARPKRFAATPPRQEERPRPERRRAPERRPGPGRRPPREQGRRDNRRPPRRGGPPR